MISAVRKGFKDLAHGTRELRSIHGSPDSHA